MDGSKADEPLEMFTAKIKVRTPKIHLHDEALIVRIQMIASTALFLVLCVNSCSTGNLAQSRHKLGVPLTPAYGGTVQEKSSAAAFRAYSDEDEHHHTAKPYYGKHNSGPTQSPPHNDRYLQEVNCPPKGLGQEHAHE